MLAPENYPHVEAIRAGWLLQEAAIRRFVEEQGEAGLVVVYQYRTLTGEPTESALRQMLQHIANHGSRVAAELRIAGQNFRFSLGGHRVFFDALQVTAYKSGSNDNLLIVDVPAQLSVPDAGRSVALRVENGLGSVTRTITVVPFDLTLQGNVDVLWRDEVSPNPSPNPIVPGQAALFAYALNSRASRQATFQVNPTVSQTGWQGLVQVLDAGQNLLNDRSITLASGERRNFFIRITQVPGGTNGQQFSLSTSATSGPVTGSDSRQFTVGTPTIPSDDTINLSSPVFSAIDPMTGANVPGASFVGNLVTLPTNALGALEYSVNFELAGTYQLTAQAAAGTTGWSINVIPGQYVESAPNQSEAPRVTIQAGAAASTTGEVVFRIQRQGATSDQTRRYQLQRV
jgi:hypothetical protein